MKGLILKVDDELTPAEGRLIVSTALGHIHTFAP